MVSVSLYATYDLDFSLDKVAGTLLGVFVFFALTEFVDGRRKLRLLLFAFCLSGVIAGGVGLLGTSWKVKVPFFSGLVQILPDALILGFPRVEEGFNSNPVGGTMVLFVPLFFMLCLYLFRKSQTAN